MTVMIFNIYRFITPRLNELLDELIPLEVCKGIERKMNTFLWGNEGMNKGIRWLSRDKLYVTKGRGLGVKKLHEFNIAMLAKQG